MKILDSKIENNEKLFLLKSDSGKTYGEAILSLREDNPVLKKIFIIPRLRNNGYGTILLNNIIDWVISNEYDEIIVKNHKCMNNFLEKERFVRKNDDYILSGLMEYKKEEKTMLFASKFAIIINIILTFLKIICGLLFNSMALMIDGINSITDLVTNILVILGIKIGRNIGDKEHPFGHGKVESVFSVIIGTFIIMTALDVIKENFFTKNNEIIITKNLILISILLLIIKIFQFIFIKYKTHKYRGALIDSLLKDYKSDIIISFSVIISIVFSKINPNIDKFIGLIVGINIIKTGYDLIKENALILMDSQDENFLEKIKNEIMDISEVKNAHNFRMTTAGKDIFIIMDIRLDKDKTVEESHNIANEIVKQLKQKYKNIKDVIIHIEPIYEFVEN